jgi:uncharacterized protein
MIPRFPAFKPLELSDSTEISVLTRRFPPYSDFNFVSLWSWNTQQQFQISTLHGNLVTRFTDYVSGAPFYSFLGDLKINETAHDLLARSISEGVGHELRLVPEHAASQIDTVDFCCDLDSDGSDYLLSVARLRAYDHSDLRDKRRQANRFLRDHPSHSLVRLDLTWRPVQHAILDLFGQWALRRGTPDPYDLAEFHALERLLAAVEFLPELHGLGVYMKEKLVAFIILELLPRKDAMAHYWKANTEYVDLYAYLMRETGKYLAEHGRENLNAQQDLGLPGLRHNKSSYVPSAYLRKYTLSRRVARTHRPILSIPAVPPVFLASAMPEALGTTISLRAPMLSPALLDLAAFADAEPEPTPIRDSGIRLAPQHAAGAEETAPPADETSKTRTG